ncbi:MAG: plastocyanin/azurin family copper-binding protein [Candidatus Nanohaloarchaea archaeon]
MRIETLFLALVIVASGCLHAAPGTAEPDQTSDSGTKNPQNGNTQTATGNNSGSGTNTVYYTSSGFQPSTITIQQGETVTWVNNASASMWVGSNRHPTHTRYAGTSLREHCQNGDQISSAFDQCSTGDRFSFTFERTGEWGYHNHKNFVHKGTVVVE